MVNLETLATLGTQDTGRRKTKQKTQHNTIQKTEKMSKTDLNKNQGWIQDLVKGN